MKAQAPDVVKRVISAWVIGAFITLTLLAILGSGLQSRLLIVPLRPALTLIELMGFGPDRHSGITSILMATVNSIFFGTVIFVIILLARKCWEAKPGLGSL